jgi:hypothetical protein
VVVLLQPDRNSKNVNTGTLFFNSSCDRSKGEPWKLARMYTLWGYHALLTQLLLCSDPRRHTSSQVGGLKLAVLHHIWTGLGLRSHKHIGI